MDATLSTGLVQTESRSAHPAWRSTIPWALFGWMIPPLILLSLSGSKLMTYVLPLFPGIAIWLAHGLLSREGKPVPKSATWTQIGFLGLFGSIVFFGVEFTKWLPVEITVDRWFLPLWVLAISGIIVAFWRLRQGITERRIAVAAMAAAIVWSVLASQTIHFGSLLGMGASARPLAERLQEEPDWERAQIIVAETNCHGIGFYLQQLVEGTRYHADIVLEPTPEMEARIHEGGAELRFRDPENIPCYLITREREVKYWKYCGEKWTMLQQEGRFVLLRYNPL